MFMTRKALLASGILTGIAVATAAGFVWSGVYDVGADDQHTRPVYALVQTLRDRSIEVRAKDLQVPDLKDAARIAQGAGNYDAMCTGCHLTPGATETELSKGLYPAPPNLTRQTVAPARAFWVIKHGVKASAMPAWGKSMEDEYIWNMVAFLQKLPGLDAGGYAALVAQSGGHSHGGGETDGHSHAGMEQHEHDERDEEAGHSHSEEEGEADHHHESPASSTQPAPMTHVHADGKLHVHATTSTAMKEPASTVETAPAADAARTTEPDSDGHTGHDHQH